MPARDPVYVLIETHEEDPGPPDIDVPYSAAVLRLVDERQIDWSVGEIPDDAVLFMARKSSNVTAMQEMQDYCRSQGIDAHELPVKDERGRHLGMATDRGMQWPEA